MRALFELSDGWFLAAWWLLAALAVVALWMWVRWLRFPNGGPTLESGDPITGCELAEVARDPFGWGPGLVALMSVVHREILVIDDAGKLQKGPRRLDSDASPLHAWIVQHAHELNIHALVEAAEARHRPAMQARLQARGLLTLPRVALAERFVHGCTLLLLLAIGGVRLWWWWRVLTFHYVCGFVFSMAVMSWLFSVVIRRRAPKPTGRAWKSIAQLTADRQVLASFEGCLTPDTPVSQVELAAGLWGLPMMSRALPRLSAAVVNGPMPPPPVRAGPGPARPLVDEALVQRLLLPTPPDRLERIAARSLGVVLVAAAATLGLMAWISAVAGPPSWGDRAGGTTFVEPTPLRWKDAQGLTHRVEPIPPARRGTRPPACDGRTDPKAESSLLGMVIEREHARDTVDEILDPSTKRRPMSTASARPGQILAVTDRALFELVLDGEDVTVIERGPVLAKVPSLGPERLANPYKMHTTTLRSLAFDPGGWLWATGDERLYVCDVSTATCVPEGLVPVDARAVAFWTPGPGQSPALVVVCSSGVERLERVAAPSFMGTAGGGFVAQTELCTSAGPPWSAAVVVGPVEDRQGTAHVIVQRGEGFVSTTLRDGEPVEPGIDLPPPLDPVALLPLDTGLLVLSSRGHILRAEPGTGALRLLATTGRPWRAAAAYLGPTPGD